MLVLMTASCELWIGYKFSREELMPKLPCSNFDLAKRDADNGLAETKRIFGNEYEGDWNHVYKESRWNLLPKWQVRPMALPTLS